jgi:RimJ/RimL family protein N-acetyltransferase
VLETLEAQGRPARAQRMTWLKALRKAYSSKNGVSGSPRSAGLRQRLWRLALDCDDWPLVAAVGTAMREFSETSVDDDVNLGIALWRQGRFDEAVDTTRKILLAHPSCERADALYDRLHAWSHRYLCEPSLLCDEALHLELLGHHHIEDFRWQYDASVVELCCLPAFRDDGHWHAWLEECLSQSDQALFGIWHRIWGFIGCVSLTVNDGIGFFYYWLGPDFRGYGYAPRAGTLLLDWAARASGLRACYAKAYTENHSSHIGLSKIGFASLDVPIERDEAPPEHLYRRPAPNGDVTEEARRFLAAIEAETRILRPWMPPPAPNRRRSRSISRPMD